MYNGFANMTITKDYRIIKAAIWAFLFTLVSFHILNSLGMITFAPKPFFWIGSIVGALVFSLGMVLAGSCIVGTPLRAASGRLVYWLGLLGMGFGGWLVIWGPWTAFRKETLQAANEVTLGGSAPTLDAWLGINSWIAVVALVAIGAWLLYVIQTQEKKQGGFQQVAEENAGKEKGFKLWPPVAIGVGLAVVEVAAFLSGKSPAGLGGFIKGWAAYFNGPIVGKMSFAWPATLVLGILVGVFVTAIITKEFRLVKPKDWKQSLRVFLGGTLMGLGAVTAAGGCNVAHILSHMPQLSIGSFVSGIVIIITAPLLIKYLVLGGKI